MSSLLRKFQILILIVIHAKYIYFLRKELCIQFQGRSKADLGLGPSAEMRAPNWDTTRQVWNLFQGLGIVVCFWSFPVGGWMSEQDLLATCDSSTVFLSRLTSWDLT